MEDDLHSRVSRCVPGAYSPPPSTNSQQHGEEASSSAASQSDNKRDFLAPFLKAVVQEALSPSTMSRMEPTYHPWL